MPSWTRMGTQGNTAQETRMGRSLQQLVAPTASSRISCRASKAWARHQDDDQAQTRVRTSQKMRPSTIALAPDKPSYTACMNAWAGVAAATTAPLPSLSLPLHSSVECVQLSTKQQHVYCTKQTGKQMWHQQYWCCQRRTPCCEK
jgi:hypothetical protein